PRIQARPAPRTVQNMSQSNEPAPAVARVSESHRIAERRAKLAALRERGIAFPNDFNRADFAGYLQAEFAAAAKWPGEALEALPRTVAIAGRRMAKRVMGEASIAQVMDESGKIQLFLQGNVLGEAYEAFKSFDVSDIVAVEGGLTRSRTGELSVK